MQVTAEIPDDVASRLAEVGAHKHLIWRAELQDSE
jgi:hypothetical protein